MNRLLHLFRRPRFDNELAEEIEEHVREKIEELTSRGLSHQEALSAARRQFGNATVLTEQSRSEWSLPAVESIGQDLRYALRVLGRSPAFSIVAVLSLALGIGSNGVVFAVVDHVLLRPLPYSDPAHLVSIWASNPAEHEEHGQISAADFFDWREKNAVFRSLSGYSSWPMNLTNVAEPMRLNGELVSANFFATLGVTPALGRTFTADEDQPDKGSVVVLSHRLWSQLGASPQIAGSTLTLNNSRTTVIGVMPSSFDFLGRDTDFWIPLALSAQNRTNREGHWLSVVGRLAPRSTLAQATASMDVVANQLAAAYPATNKGWGVRLVPLQDELVGHTRVMMLAAQGAVGLLLLITCANLANLLLARSSTRSREIAVRAALGASRARIARQLVVESALLASVGGALGVGLAEIGLRALRTFGEGLIPRLNEVYLDTRVLSYTLLATGVTALLFGLLPALRATRFDLRRHIQSGGRGLTHGTERQRGLLVAAELAMACILLVGASLLTESLAHTYAMKPGFQVENVLTMRILLSHAKYPGTSQQVAFFDQVAERVATVPGIVAVGEVSDAPLSLNNMTPKFVVERGEPSVKMGLRFLTPGYLSTVGISLLSGRDIERSDTASSPAIALVNQTAARRYWPGADPIGKRLRLAEEQRWLTVAGVVGDIRHLGLTVDEGPVVYVPYAQKTWEFLGWATLAIRTTGDPMTYVSAVRGRILSIDKDQPVSAIATLEQTLSRSTAAPRLTTSVVGAVSLLALMMALVGAYGVVAYTVAQRTPEIGIRVALGATPRQLLSLLLWQGMLRASIGIAVGLFGAWLLTRALASLLFGVPPRDPATFVSVAAMLLLAALIAVLLPARRALRIDPVRALRNE